MHNKKSDIPSTKKTIIGTAMVLVARALPVAAKLMTKIKTPAGLTATGLGTSFAFGNIALGIVSTAIAAIGSLLALTQSSDIIVDNGEKIGKKLGLSSLIIGTIAGIVTSFPELSATIVSAMKGMPEIGIGNIVGSNIANLLLVLGVTGTVAGISTAKVKWKNDGKIMAGTTLAFAGLLAAGIFSPLVGAALLTGGIAYMSKDFFGRKKETEAQNPPKSQQNSVSKKNIFKPLINASLGIGALILSANMLVEKASALALSAGISTAFIGTIGVAIGTSLPELMVSYKSAKKGNPGMAIGNVLGSNIFNMLLVGSAAAFFSKGVPAEFSAATTTGIFNLSVFTATALAAAYMLSSDKKFSRKEGLISLAAYAVFTAISFIQGKEGNDISQEIQKNNPPEKPPTTYNYEIPEAPSETYFRDMVENNRKLSPATIARI
jgi:cation:H+ antiporter